MVSSTPVAARSVPEERCWEDLAAGDRLRGPVVTITEAHLVAWAGLTGDFVPLRMDAHSAASGRFDQRIAHGPLTLGLGLMAQAGYLANAIAWLGLTDLRARVPVFIGDTVHPEAVVESRCLDIEPVARTFAL
jgi:acyl dehydratase